MPRILPIVEYGPLLQDPEFDIALERAEQIDLPDVAEARDYPFSLVDRKESAIRFAPYAAYLWLEQQPSNCAFVDIDSLESIYQEAIIAWCQRWLFKGYKGTFEPNFPLTKASAVVAIARSLFPDETFPEVKEFRVPYMQKLEQFGIIQHPDHPYLMYPISRYELLLMLYRAWTLQKTLPQ